VSSNSGGSIPNNSPLAAQLAQLSNADLRHLWAYITTRRRIYLHCTHHGWSIIP